MFSDLIGAAMWLVMFIGGLTVACFIMKRELAGYSFGVAGVFGLIMLFGAETATDIVSMGFVIIVAMAVGFVSLTKPMKVEVKYRR